jgi:hypothetical protein
VSTLHETHVTTDSHGGPCGGRATCEPTLPRAYRACSRPNLNMTRRPASKAIVPRNASGVLPRDSVLIRYHAHHDSKDDSDVASVSAFSTSATLFSAGRSSKEAARVGAGPERRRKRALMSLG